MNIFSQAIQAVQRNLAAFGLYIMITVGAGLAVVCGNYLMGDPGPDTAWTAPLLLYEFAVDLALVAATAFAQSIVFSRFGKEMDRPLWKVAGDLEALRRYFKLWFVLNVVVVVCFKLAIFLPILLGDDRYQGGLLWLFVFTAAACVPVGAAIMFSREFHWRTLAESLAPFRRQIGKAALLFCANGLFLFFFLALLIPTEEHPWLRPVVDVISSYFDCVIFAATWQVCRLDRDAPSETDLEF